MGVQEPRDNKDSKREIVEKIAELSRLLGMIPGDDTVTVSEPLTQDSMELSTWFSDARSRFLELSILIGRALDIQLQ